MQEAHGGLPRAAGRGKISKNASAGRDPSFLLSRSLVAPAMATATRPASVAAPIPVPDTGAQPLGTPPDRRERPSPERSDGAPWWSAAAALSALVVAGALLPRPELLDAVSGRAVAGAALERPALYTALAPLTTTFDALALLSVRQHIAVIIGALLCFAAWRASRPMRGFAPRGVFGESALGLLFGAAIFAVQAVACLVPRPMAALVVRDPNVVRVDFHTHTAASHDGRRWFDAERVREWHRSGGFDVAYVTDHGTWTGAEAGERANPGRAGDGTILLSAVEAWSGGEHLNILGARATDSLFLLPDEQIDDESMKRAVAAGRRAPVLVGTIPGNLDTLALGVAGNLPGRALGRVVAIELADAAPRGFEQSDSARGRALRIADSLNLALVAGSDNHGWGRTAAAWSLLTIPGWREMPADSLGRAIESRIHSARRRAVRVVERSRPRTIRGAGVLLNAPVVLWHLFASLDPAERAAWLAWTWAIALAWRARRRRRIVSPPLRVVRGRDSPRTPLLVE